MKENKTLSFTIYYALKDKPQSIESLLEYVQKAGYTISARSIYRHIQKIDDSLDPSTEKLEIEVGNYGKKTFFIHQKTIENSPIPKNNAEWADFIIQQFLFIKTAHQHFVKNDKSKPLIDWLINHAPLKVKEISGMYSFVHYFENSEFGQANLSTGQKQILLDLLWCLQNDTCFKVTEFDHITTLKHDLIPKVNQVLKPIKIVYHRGDFIINCASLNNGSFFALELEKIKKLKFTEVKIGNEFNLEEYDTKNNFGIHPPINKTIYQIKLLFPPTPGGYVMNRRWHHSQKFKKRRNGYVEMELTCRICIELLGWIMMWMDNVEVLAPQKLNDLLKVRIANMQKINAHQIPPINNSDSLTAKAPKKKARLKQ